MRLALAALALLLSLPAAAQNLLKQSEWLPPGAAVAGDLLHRPVEALEGGVKQNFFVEFGRLAFRSPEILGGNARRAGISCNACHSNGHVNTRFFVPGVSGKPGTVDVTNKLWNLRGEDGLLNPITIPTLRDVGRKPRLGRDARSASVHEFSRAVIVTEFGGDEPSPFLLDALTAYMVKLRKPVSNEPEKVTLAKDLEDLMRYTRVLRVVQLDEDAGLTELTVRMIRGQIGFIAERFFRPEHEVARAALAAWVDDLRAIEELGRNKDFPAARARLAAMAPPPSALLAAEKTSLYDPGTVKEVLR